MHQRSDSKVLAAATNCAVEAGYKVENYSVEIDRSDAKEIAVFFVGKEKRPGNHFTVYVNPTSLDCRVMPGR
jgi:hypothetical protein